MFSMFSFSGFGGMKAKNRFNVPSSATSLPSLAVDDNSKQISSTNTKVCSRRASETSVSTQEQGNTNNSKSRANYNKTRNVNSNNKDSKSNVNTKSNKNHSVNANDKLKPNKENKIDKTKVVDANQGNDDVFVSNLNKDTSINANVNIPNGDTSNFNSGINSKPTTEYGVSINELSENSDVDDVSTDHQLKDNQSLHLLNVDKDTRYVIS